MKKGQIRTGVVRNVKFPDRAMVELEPLEGAADGEEICEVKGALPGQKISVVITKVRKGKGEGRLKEILEKSPIETVGIENGGCPHFNICGGCSYISMPYEESLKIKETDRLAALTDELAKLGYVLESDGNGSISWSGECCDAERNPAICTYDDHRMAMSFAPACLCRESVVIKDPEVVTKSYPRYWEDLAAVGFVIEKR